MCCRSKRVVLLLMFLVTLTVAAVGQDSTPKITSFRIAREGLYGPLFVTIDHTERKIANQAQKAWIIDAGRKVVYSAGDGAGGYENEGQSLRVYDARTGTARKILSEYYEVEAVEAVVTSTRQTALLVTMADGGLGASYIAVVDPLRGEVFFRRWARILSRNGDNIVLGFYKEEDWDQLNTDEASKVKPYKTERHNLKTILKGQVIRNKRDQ